MNLSIAATILKLLLLLYNQSEQGKLSGHTKYCTPLRTCAHYLTTNFFGFISMQTILKIQTYHGFEGKRSFHWYA